MGLRDGARNLIWLYSNAKDGLIGVLLRRKSAGITSTERHNMKTKYVGCVTDASYTKALFRLPFHRRKEYSKYLINEIEYHGGLNFVWGLNRQPRVYSDEL